MKWSVAAVVGAVLVWTMVVFGAGPKTLDFYFIDVEGGQATLIVTAAGQSVLVDSGFPGSGTFQSISGDPHSARDAPRILDAAKAAGVEKIDYLIVSHFHADHVGGVPELAQVIPIRTFVDHDRVVPEAETNVPGTLAAFDRYAAVRAKGQHIVAKVGGTLPLDGLDLVFVSSAGETLTKPLRGAGGANGACANGAVEAQEPNENPRSTGFWLRFGKFTFLDPADLTGKPLHALVCPNDLIGPVALYLAAHHGGLDAADAATLAAFRPRATIVDNGPGKGGTPGMAAALRQAGSLQDTWLLHPWNGSDAAGGDESRVANLDRSTAYWIKVSAREDGSFQVMNGRTGSTVSYPAR